MLCVIFFDRLLELAFFQRIVVQTSRFYHIMQIMWFLKVFEYRNQVMEGLRMPEILQIVQSATPPIVEQPVLRKRGSAKDISGQQFGRLTALYPTEQRDARGYVICTVSVAAVERSILPITPSVMVICEAAVASGKKNVSCSIPI